MRSLLRFYIVTSVLFLTGCTSIGSHILSNPDIYLSNSQFEDIDLARFDIEKRQYCEIDTSQCTAYLYAKAYEKQDFPEDADVHYTIHAMGNGVENEIYFSMDTDNFGKYQGTAILIHGFGGSKEAMVFTSIFFRAMGMDVIALDLFGHGESTQDFAFGAKEHQLYSNLLDSQLHQNVLTENSPQTPVIVVAHSMGALPAAKLLQQSDKVDGAILLAPMVQFDKAIKHYLAYKSQTLNKLFADNLHDITREALQNADIAIESTNILHSLNQINKPTLLINSDVDSVSPTDYFFGLQNPNIQQINFEGRSHPSLISFGNEDVAVFENWMRENF